ncbi:YidC/Oxa1 family membrane protein insertase [Patescibacteria group bacterium]|nr:YidC/Oxa1 family membrane protein insertase [Patescibacteria group bacterium]
MSWFWQTFFYGPLFNLLVFIYNQVGDLGLAIIILTILLKIILYPLSRRSLQSQKALQQLQPKVEELKRKNKGNKEAMSRELMALYQQEKVSPFSSCLPLLIQLPFLFALYSVFGSGLSTNDFSGLYSFVANPGAISDLFLGFWSLGKPNIILAVITGLSQYWQAKMLMSTKPAISGEASKDEGLAASINKQALYIMPVMTMVFGFTLPAGLILYWLMNTLITIGQQYLTFTKNEEKVVS